MSKCSNCDACRCGAFNICHCTPIHMSRYPDCNGIYPHSITKEGCVYCKGLEDFGKALSPPFLLSEDAINSVDMSKAVNVMNALFGEGRNEDVEYQPGPWYCELIYKFTCWCYDWLEDLEDWAIIQENKARKKNERE